MHSERVFLLLITCIGLHASGGTSAASGQTAIAEATIRVHARQLEPHRIPPNLTGKFCEHLGANIYNGMDAQILRNPTFADYPFWTGRMSPDGITMFQSEREKIEGELRQQAARYGWPAAELDSACAAYRDGLACFWGRVGAADSVQVSPDTGPAGGRAQRLELKPGGGIKQWMWLPLHRTNRYEFELLARSPGLARLKLAVLAKESKAPAAVAVVEGISGEWQAIKGSFSLPDSSPADAPYCLTLTSESAAQVVIGHLFLRPADHINGADPDVIRLLKESRLPLLRWPGGNFVSAYHWEDGIGPVERRPTRPNYAWGGVEPNTFGTDEFVAFCSALGCEPMICINAGTGTPEEAARWVEYCNGPAGSPMGSRRAANGHPEPFRVRHWEVGNELWGHWQAHWTTAKGYVDRYRRFAKAMLASDPAIELHACGAPVLWGKAWNDTLIDGTARELSSITDHPLIGGDVPRTTDPLDVFRDFMHVPDILERKWAELRDNMTAQGIKNPRLAVTELQMFAHVGGERGAGPDERLNHRNLVNPGTLGEALYDTMIYHAVVRLQPFIEMVTHSATVNHGGGLRKERERVYANPCHYANQLFAEFAGATPVKVEVKVATERAPIILPDIKNAGGEPEISVVDALAAITSNGDLLVSLVHRGTAGPERVLLSADGFSSAERARVSTLSGAVPWAVNTLEKPAAIQPAQSEIEVHDSSLTVVIQPFSIVQVRFTPK